MEKPSKFLRFKSSILSSSYHKIILILPFNLQFQPSTSQFSTSKLIFAWTTLKETKKSYAKLSSARKKRFFSISTAIASRHFQFSICHTISFHLTESSTFYYHWADFFVLVWSIEMAWEEERAKMEGGGTAMGEFNECYLNWKKKQKKK